MHLLRRSLPARSTKVSLPRLRGAVELAGSFGWTCASSIMICNVSSECDLAESEVARGRDEVTGWYGGTGATEGVL